METISFFSYKGGSCRTSTALNTIPYIAKELGASKDKPLVVMDMDLNSVGMSLLVGLDYSEEENDLAFFMNKRKEFSTDSAYNNPFLKLLRPVGAKFGLVNDAILFVGSGVETPLSEIGSGRDLEFIDSVRRLCKNLNYAGLILDLPAGSQAAANMSVDISDTIVVCMRPTDQFRMGTFRYINRFIRRSKGRKARVKIVVLPTAVPPDTKIDVNGEKVSSHDNLRAMLEQELFESNKTAQDYQSSYEVEPRMTGVDDKGVIGIPEVTRFKWKEGILYTLGGESQTDDEIMAGGQYERLAKIVIRR